jgi:tetratricopeptide (TPR) repeat protein
MSDLQRALDLDPSFAEAASALAGEYQWAGSVGFLEQSVAIERTRHFAELALKLDPNLVGPRESLGFIQLYEWNWPAAEQELKRARALAPNNTSILQDLAWLSLTLGRGDDALKYVNASLVVDPLEAAGYFWLSIVQSHLGRLPEAEASMRRALEFSPTSILYHYILGLILLGRSQPDAALTEMLKEPDDNSRLAGSAMAYFALGRKIESDAALAQLLKGHANHPFYIGLVYSFRGEPDETFKWLDRAYEQKDPQLITVKFEGPLNSLHGDPRYKAFLKKMNLPE